MCGIAACGSVFHRKLFRFTPSDKINETEADIVVRLVQSINRIYEANGKPFSSEMLGIIAPYRNQIALIKHKLASAGISDYEKIMVDTVERFQGSQRESDFYCRFASTGLINSI